MTPPATPAPRTDLAQRIAEKLLRNTEEALICHANFKRGDEMTAAVAEKINYGITALIAAELASWEQERDDAIKAHGVVWNAVKKASQYFRWKGLADTIAVEAANVCYNAEKLTPKWSTDWVIVTPLELSTLRAANAKLAEELAESRRVSSTRELSFFTKETHDGVEQFKPTAEAEEMFAAFCQSSDISSNVLANMPMQREAYMAGLLAGGTELAQTPTPDAAQAAAELIDEVLLPLQFFPDVDESVLEYARSKPLAERVESIAEWMLAQKQTIRDYVALTETARLQREKLDELEALLASRDAALKEVGEQLAGMKEIQKFTSDKLATAESALAAANAEVERLNSIAAAHEEGVEINSELNATIATLTAQLAAGAADSRRLDWLSDNPIHDWGFGQFPQSITMNGIVYTSVREAIDAAMTDAATRATEGEGRTPELPDESSDAVTG